MAGSTKEILLSRLRSGAGMGRRERLRLTLLLSMPAILAQFSSCMMSCIDAAMVGRLGSAQAAAIGLVSTTTWVFGSFCYANSSGFSVQIAHRCGAGDFPGARRIFRCGLLAVLAASILLSLLGAGIHQSLPRWLGGSPEVLEDAAAYFLIYALFIPVFQTAVFAQASLVASGNVKLPSIVSILMCVADVALNYLFIFILDLGVRGAALGTGLAMAMAAVFLLAYASGRSPEIGRRAAGPALAEGGGPEDSGRGAARGERAGTDPETLGAASVSGAVRGTLRNALGICWPLWLQNLISRGAYVAATVLIAPLGTVAIAANSFAIIVEGFCYLPGYGMQDAATTLVGQSLGAGRRDMAGSFARITIATGSAMMTVLAVLMWVWAPQMMGLLSTDPEVISLGARCLRIEAWAELLYGVGIVAYGCCVGAGDTLVPSAINLLSMWVIRLGLALLLIPPLGIEGYWVAMAAELSVKGIVFAVRIRRGRWMKKVFAS